jgi:hypothetical protein
MGFPEQTPGYQAGFTARQPGSTNGLALAALVCGLAQFLLWFFVLVPGFIAAVLALTFGLAGLSQIRDRAEGGQGMAVAGVGLGVLGVLGGIAWVIIFAAGTVHFRYDGFW